MTKFKVGDKVQLTVESLEYYEDPENGFRYEYIKPWGWQAIYLGNLTVDKVYRCEPVLYGTEETNVGFYEFELERD